MSPLVVVRDVRKEFATITAVDGLSFEIRGGEIFALLGPNGAGKTTMLRMLLGLLRPDAGTVEFHDQGATPLGMDARRVGYLPEERGLYQDVNVVRTLTYFGALRGMQRRAAHDAAEEWLERMQLRDRMREPLKSLSKGNQQKVQFISAVLHRPRLAVLDEPFAGLDPLNQDFFLTLIRELQDGGTTVVLSAHQMQLVERVADRILVVNRGREVVHGSLEDVRQRWTTGRRLKLRLASAPPAGFVSMLQERATVESPEPLELELFVADGEPLAPILAEIGTQLDVRDIESRSVTLHDVYVAAIAQHDGASGDGQVR